MIYITNNILAVPFLLAVWTLDLYLTAAAARLVLGRCQSNRAVHLAEGLAPFTDWLPRAVERWLCRYSHAVTPQLSWAIIFASGLIVHHLLLRLALSMA